MFTYSRMFVWTPGQCCDIPSVKGWELFSAQRRRKGGELHPPLGRCLNVYVLGCFSNLRRVRQEQPMNVIYQHIAIV